MQKLVITDFCQRDSYSSRNYKEELQAGGTHEMGHNQDSSVMNEMSSEGSASPGQNSLTGCPISSVEFVEVIQNVM